MSTTRADETRRRVGDAALTAQTQVAPSFATPTIRGPRFERELRTLLSCLALPPATFADEEEVAMSAELDGIRYTLVRKRAPGLRTPVSLSAREHEIARLISAGYTNKTVAAALEISLWTVDTHIRRIFAKLGVRSRSAMVARLAEHGHLPTAHAAMRADGRASA